MRNGVLNENKEAQKCAFAHKVPTPHIQKFGLIDDQTRKR